MALVVVAIDESKFAQYAFKCKYRFGYLEYLFEICKFLKVQLSVMISNYVYILGFQTQDEVVFQILDLKAVRVVLIPRL